MNTYFSTLVTTKVNEKDLFIILSWISLNEPKAIKPYYPLGPLNGVTTSTGREYTEATIVNAKIVS